MDEVIEHQVLSHKSSVFVMDTEVPFILLITIITIIIATSTTISIRQTSETQCMQLCQGVRVHTHAFVSNVAQVQPKGWKGW